MSAPNCCKISAPGLPGACTNFLTGLGEAIAAADKGDNAEWWGCREVQSERCQDILWMSESRAQEWWREQTEMCSVHLQASRREWDTCIYFSCMCSPQYSLAVKNSLLPCWTMSGTQVPKNCRREKCVKNLSAGTVAIAGTAAACQSLVCFLQQSLGAASFPKGRAECRNSCTGLGWLGWWDGQSSRKGKPGWGNASCWAEQRMAAALSLPLMSAAFDRVSQVARLLSGWGSC